MKAQPAKKTYLNTFKQKKEVLEENIQSSIAITFLIFLFMFFFALECPGVLLKDTVSDCFIRYFVVEDGFFGKVF